jgi:hypothetical protein
MDGELKRRTINLRPDGLLVPRAPVLAIRFGRGRTVGSTMLDLLVQLARSVGRDVVVGDGDCRNPTLASFYPPGTPGGASQPRSDELPDIKDWITDLVGGAIGRDQSIVLDLGGGDRAIQEYGHDMNLIETCEDCGIEPLGLFFCGPDQDDFEHVLAIWEAGYFRPKRAILVLNQHLVSPTRTVSGAFDATLGRPEIAKLESQGMKALFLRRLPCMEPLRQSGLSFIEAISGKCGPNDVPFDPMRQAMIRIWISDILRRLADIGALEWLP